MKMKLSKISLFCISTLLITSVHCKPTDTLVPRPGTPKANTEQVKAQQQKSTPKTREERIKTIVEENDKKTKTIQADMDSRHHKKHIMKKNCNIAKNRLQDLMSTPRIKITANNGSMRYMTQTEKTEEIKKARQAIKRYCGQ